MVRIPTPPSRTGDHRLLSLIFALFLTCVLMAYARRPETWRRLGFGPLPAAPVAGNSSENAWPSTTSHAAAAPIPAAEVDLTRASAAAPPLLLPAERLEAVRDDTLQVADDDSWFDVWTQLRDTSAERLADLDAGPIAYAQLTHQPGVYRGGILSVRGNARRVRWVAAPQNRAGIDGYWQIWLEAAHGPRSPWVVYCLQLPPAFPRGDSVNVPFACQAMFYKRYAYAAADGLRTAPLLMASTVQALPASQPQTRAEVSAGQSGLAVLVAALVAAMLAVIAYRSTTGSARLSRRQQLHADDQTVGST